MLSALVRRPETTLPTSTGFDSFDRLFNEFLAAPFAWRGLEPSGPSVWMPPVNIEETDEAMLVTADLPGLSKDDVNVTIENNVLTVSGERKWEQERQNRNLHRVERGYGKFVRSFALPHRVVADRVQAKFQDGVLHLTIPKSEDAKPRRIAIR